jgi:hypothetical protein
MNQSKFIAHNHALKDTPFEPGRVRTFFFAKFGIWDIWDILPSGWKFRYFDHIYPIFNPQNERVRKIIPRKWVDISSLIENVNFEFVKAFYEEEYIDGIVDWDAQPEHREFADWLEATYAYITVERPLLEQQLDEAYPPTRSLDKMFEPCEVDENGKVKMYKMVDDGLTYEQKYGEVNRIEKNIEDRDTEVLLEIIKYRHFFWT